MGNCQSAAEQHCRHLSWWKEAVCVASTVEAYMCICQYMFEDGKVNGGRLEVLEVFTKDVCDLYPHLATQIWQAYRRLTCEDHTKMDPV